jgi:hypothetical protein
LNRSPSAGTTSRQVVWWIDQLGFWACYTADEIRPEPIARSVARVRFPPPPLFRTCANLGRDDAVDREDLGLAVDAQFLDEQPQERFRLLRLASMMTRSSSSATAANSAAVGACAASCGVEAESSACLLAVEVVEARLEARQSLLAALGRQLALLEGLVVAQAQSSRRCQPSCFRSTPRIAATRIAPASSSSQCACGLPAPKGEGG